MVFEERGIKMDLLKKGFIYSAPAGDALNVTGGDV